MANQLTEQQFSNRVRWVKALLSGEYPQGFGKLRSYSGYCCLGVAGQVIEPDAVWISAAGYLPEQWAYDKLGLADEAVPTYHDADQICATSWNDERNLSFTQIADRVALATEKNRFFYEVGSPGELVGTDPGVYAREWVARVS